MKISKLNTFLSTLHFVLLFVGYLVVTTIFLPVSSDIEGISRTVTVPYRGFALVVALLVIILNFKRKVKYPNAVKFLFFYWFILIIRIFYDLHIRTDIYMYSEEKFRLWLFIFAITLIPTYAVIKSLKYIDLEKALSWVFGLTILTVLLSYFSNEFLQESSYTRIDSNVGLTSITLGHLGASTIILSLFYLFRNKKSLLVYLFIASGIILGGITMLRAGSRGPILSLIVVFSIWLLAKNKNGILLTISLIALSLLVYIFSERIIQLISDISPIMAARLQQEEYLLSRFPLFQTAVNAFTENPFFGSQFAIFHGDGSFIYSHNIILDSLMGMGALGGALIIYLIGISIKYSYKIIQYDNNFFWVSLILIQQITYNMVSSSIYYNPLFSILMAFIFFQYQSTKRKGYSYI